MPTGLKTLLSLEVPVIVQIAERVMTVNEVTSNAPGAIIELSKPADAVLDIRVNNKVIGTGTAVKVGENYGIKVSYVGDVAERITAMGPDGQADQLAADPSD